MARLNYNFNSKYMLTATIRRDGYSGFGNDNKYGLFPTFAAAWNIGEESFIKETDWLYFLKIRGS